MIDVRDVGRAPGTVCMMDDVLVYGATQEEHDDRLRKVLQRIKQSGMTLNSEKCKFSCNWVIFLGLVDEAGIRPDPEKIQGIVRPLLPEKSVMFIDSLEQSTK